MNCTSHLLFWSMYSASDIIRWVGIAIIILAIGFVLGAYIEFKLTNRFY